MAKIALVVVGCAALLAVVIGTIVTLWRHHTLVRPGYFLLTSAAVAVAVFTLTTAWLIIGDPHTSHSDDIRTGGIGAAAVLALYGLWLNDRRRRTDEYRNETERRRLEEDRERTAGERFSRAIELLGNADEAVKLGALHSLATLGRRWPELVQPVLDVFCAYLRMPFDTTSTDRGRALQVRLTAQRLIQDVLSADVHPDVHPDGRRRLDLSGAELHDFSLTEVVVDTLLATGMVGYGTTTLDGLRVAGECGLDRSRFVGPVSADGATFRTLTLGQARFADRVSLSDATVGTSVATDTVHFAQGVRLTRLTCDGRFCWRIEAGGPVDFADTTFGQGLDIARSHFAAKVTFRNAWLGDATDFDGVSFAAVDLLARRLPNGFDPQRLTATVEPTQLPNQLKQVRSTQPGAWWIRRS